MPTSRKDAQLTLVTVAAVLAIGGGIASAVDRYSVVVNGQTTMLWCAVLALLIQIVAWIPASLKQTETYFDLTGGLTYIGLVVLSLWFGNKEHPPSAREWILSGMVILWAIRLASFLFLRIQRAGKDQRFDELKTSPVRFLVPWSLQGLWVFLTLVAVLVVNLQSTPAPPLGPLDVAGIALWVLGFSVEVVADRQKTAFNRNPENRDKWIDTGLWSYSRHPNYFGEILLWSGIALSGASVFSGSEWWALVSPIFVAILLTKISGIPLLDRKAFSKWGHNPDYLAYRKRTRALLPLP
jgi:steroid 5-alpha reductase family enzyme